MSYFKAKMYQIQFQLGLRRRPSWGSLSPNPLAGFKGGRLPLGEKRGGTDRREGRGLRMGDVLLRRGGGRKGHGGLVPPAITVPPNLKPNFANDAATGLGCGALLLEFDISIDDIFRPHGRRIVVSVQGDFPSTHIIVSLDHPRIKLLRFFSAVTTYKVTRLFSFYMGHSICGSFKHHVQCHRNHVSDT